MDNLALAHEMIRAIRAAMARGVKHRDLSGKLLTNEKEVLEALLRDGQISLEGP